MKKFALAVALMACGTVGAEAASPVYNWTGFYIGGNVGYSWGQSSTRQDFNDTLSGALLSTSTSNNDMNGVIGGGQAGYNWQNNRWVFGVETDIQASGQRGSGIGTCGGGTLAVLNSACAAGHVGDTRPFDVAALPVTSGLSQRLDWFGTVRGRIGPTISPTVLPYFTGGLAYGQISTTNAVAGTNITGANGTNVFLLTPVAGSSSFQTTRVGWTVGAGLEGVISGNWTAKIEYLYIDLGTVSGSQVTPVTATSGAFVTSRFSSHITDNILRVGFNYKLGGPY